MQTTWSLELRKPTLELRDSLSLPFLLLWEPDMKKFACACHTKCEQKRNLLQCLTQEVKNPQEKRDHEIMLSVGFVCLFLFCFASPLSLGAPRLSSWYIDATAPGSIYTLLCYEFGVGVMLMDRKGRSEMPPSFLPLSPDFCFLKFPFHCAGFPQQFERTRD